jgi:hypothetical protein
LQISDLTISRLGIADWRLPDWQIDWGLLIGDCWIDCRLSDWQIDWGIEDWERAGNPQSMCQ